jgi:hypothetical protein
MRNYYRLILLSIILGSKRTQRDIWFRDNSRSETRQSSWVQWAIWSSPADRQACSINIRTKTIFIDETKSGNRSKTSSNIESWSPVSSKWFPALCQTRKLVTVFDVTVGFPRSTSRVEQNSHCLMSAQSTISVHFFTKQTPWFRAFSFDISHWLCKFDNVT